MLHHYVIGVGAFVLLSVLWVGVQRAWRRSFSDVGDDPDALAGRPDCFGCARSRDCAAKRETKACLSQEEMR
jgi:hypothetical protein